MSSICHTSQEVCLGQNSEVSKLFQELHLKFKVQNADQILEFYDFHEVLGAGAFGTVVRCVQKQSGSVFAAKILPTQASSFKEALLLAELNHPGIIKLQDVFVNDQLVFLVLEYCETTLASLKPTTSSAIITNIAVQVLEALAYLHAKCIVHRDIKPENILLQRQPDGTIVPKIADFGIALRLGQEGSIASSAAGTNYYLAPEMIYNHYSYKVDIWSIAMVLLVLTTKNIPFRGTTQRQIFQEIVAFKPQEIAFPDWVDFNLQNLIRKLLTLSPEHRPSAEQGLTMLSSKPRSWSDASTTALTQFAFGDASFIQENNPTLH
jgi:serine/threonine protein kinase